jgi:ACS family hexuronate transporter-like MFS transporter
LLVPPIAHYWGWRCAFVVTGELGFLWVLAWWRIYRQPDEHPRLSRAELDHIRSDPPEPSAEPVPWARLLPHRQTWAFAAGKFFTDPVWWFLLFWLPKFFHETYDLDVTGLAMPLVIIYVAADVGSIVGGWLSSSLMKRGWSPNAARKTTMLACALCVVPVLAVPHFENLWLTVTLISLAAAGHQGWSANLFTLASDMFPRRAVGSVTGIGGMAGAVGNLFVAVAVGHVLTWTGGNYAPLLYVSSVAYLLALAVIHLLSPRLELMKAEP